MGREDEIVKERMKKISEMIKEKLEPYQYKYNRADFAGDLQLEFKEFENEKFGREVSVAGRILSLRNLGKIAFAKLVDNTGEIQILLQAGETPKKQFDIFNKFVDVGDIIGVKGKIYRTKRGELSVFADKIEVLTKSVKPLPSEFYGLQDKEERYRKRYIDLILNSKAREIFETRAKILEAMRDFMKEKNFLEVETPLLQGVYGGASAKPFKTHCDAFDSDVYLSIAPELYLKKAMVGGLGNVYEITKKFRNEGVDRQHNPEHMTAEWYQEYADYEDGMKMFEALIKFIAVKVLGKLEIDYQGHKINLNKWQRMTLQEAIKKYLKEDISKIKTDADARKVATKHGIDVKVTKTTIADELMKLFRDKLIQPTFLTDYPIGLDPLAKPCRKDKTKAEIFQPFIGGMELARAYSELSNPELQAEHFKEQEKEREKGAEEAMPTDKDFVEALEYGLPPACGVGIGIERLVMLFTNSDSIRDVIMFPFMRVENGTGK